MAIATRTLKDTALETGSGAQGGKGYYSSKYG